jgi:hypothetical protein
MKTINLTCGKIALVDDDDFDNLSKHKWTYAKTTGYAKRKQWIDGKQHTILMHQEVMKVTTGIEVDHRNRKKLDNRKENLRFCTSSQNRVNFGPKSNNTTGFKGVQKYGKRFKAMISGGKATYLGIFNTPEEAAKAYDSEAIKRYGEFAWLNFPDDFAKASQ